MVPKTRDARGAFRYLRLLINVWFYEKLDLTVPQVHLGPDCEHCSKADD